MNYSKTDRHWHALSLKESSSFLRINNELLLGMRYRCVAHSAFIRMTSHLILSEQGMKYPVEDERSDLLGVVVTSGGSVSNRLGVVRTFGRRRVPVVYLDTKSVSIVGCSRYVSLRLKVPSLKESEAGFVSVLRAFGEQLAGRMMIVPTGDRDVLALARHRQSLEKFYYVPVSAFETVQMLVNKKTFYKWLERMQFPYPKTSFPENVDDIRSEAESFGYPFLVKPVYSVEFQEEFGRKCFVVRDEEDLECVLSRLRVGNHEVLLQEIVPGNEIYAFYTYLNSESEPLAVCGYEKVRQYPLGFGSGTYCRSKMCAPQVESCIRLLQSIGYRGFAEPEVKRDPRDGQYKLIEINPRTSMQNRMAGDSGSAIEYVAYQNAGGKSVTGLVSLSDGVDWIDDFNDFLSCLLLLRDRRISIDDAARSHLNAKVHSIMAWDDVVPFLLDLADQTFRTLRNYSTVIAGE